ncbi:MAG: N-acetylneuraminate synthase family protein, partial [Nitrospinota bacterium]
LETIYAARNRKVILLHCTSSYPTEASDAHLRAIPYLRERFGHPVGFSDHTVGPVAALAAVALGACLIEKHFTLDRSLPGPDHKASIEPEGLKAMALGIREVEAALGEGRKRPRRAERSLRLLSRRSIVAASPIPKGSLIEEGMLTLKRPASGLPPRELPKVLGRRARKDIAADEALSWDMLS